MLNYKTGKLPPNFISLGILLFGFGVWRVVIQDWRGILFFLLSILLLIIKSGIIIDTDGKRIKKYFRFLAIRIGEWKNIKSAINLR